MITLHDIQIAVSDRLKSGGHSVIANEIKEGFKKPSFFVSVFQNSIMRENIHWELVNIGVEVRYIPAVETYEECILMEDNLHALFSLSPLQAQDRFLTVAGMEFDMDGPALMMFFELEFMREVLTPVKEYEPIKELKLGGI